MKKLDKYSKGLAWSMVLALGVAATGCGGGSRDPILGADVAVFIIPVDAVVPAGTCSEASPAIPAVIASSPTNDNQFASTSTTGTANGGKLITATFTVPMDPATINAASFVLAPTGGAALIPASVSYDAATNVATLTTASALMADTSYSAVVLPAATSTIGTPMSCAYAWSFKTAAVAAASPSIINLGLAAPFGVAATAGITNTLTSPITNINWQAR